MTHNSILRSAAATAVLLASAICTLASPQDKGRITGTVIDAATSEPIEFATIALISPDSSAVNGTTTDSAGHFTIQYTTAEGYRLLAAFIGYHDRVIDLGTAKDTGNITIALEPEAEMLEEAVITARRPVIEQKLDKIVMNISDAVSTEGSNGTDLLRKAPGVTIDFDGNVKLNGSSVAVWIRRPTVQPLRQRTGGTAAVY